MIESLESRLHPSISVFAMLRSDLVRRNDPAVVTPIILSDRAMSVKYCVILDGHSAQWKPATLQQGYTDLSASKLATSSLGRHTVEVDVMIGKAVWHGWKIGYTVVK
jgi:hypothetical protein